MPGISAPPHPSWVKLAQSQDMPTYHFNSFSFRHAAVHRHLLSLILQNLALVDAGMRRPITANNDQASFCDSVTNALLWPVCRTNVLICRCGRGG
jgi:hypothetical protein